MYDILDISYEDVHSIEELWEKNRIYHQQHSKHFKDLYGAITFQSIISGLRDIDSKDLKISIATVEDRCIAYCISIVMGKSGELKSLHVDKNYRKLGIGRDIVDRHLDWIRKRECTSINVRVSHENDSTVSFYKTLGFFPNTLDMRLK